MVAKRCPRCGQLIPVSFEVCPCGHSFFKASEAFYLSPGAYIPRRTQSVYEENPNFDALECDTQIKTGNGGCENDEEGNKRGEHKDVVYNKRSVEKPGRVAIILEMLNKKIQRVSRKPT